MQTKKCGVASEGPQIYDNKKQEQAGKRPCKIMRYDNIIYPRVYALFRYKSIVSFTAQYESKVLRLIQNRNIQNEYTL